VKILQVIPSLEVGGAESVVVTLTNELAFRGYSLEILLGRNQISDRYKISPSIKVNVATFHSKNSLGVLTSQIWWFLRNRQKVSDFDVIHLHLIGSLLLAIPLTLMRVLKILPKIRIVATCHSVGTNAPILQRIVERQTIHFVDAYTLVTLEKRWTNLLAEKEKQKTRISYIPNGVAIRAKYESNIEESKFLRVGTLSRMESDRSPHLFLSLAKYLVELLQENISFFIAGGGSLRNELENEAIKLGIHKKFNSSAQSQILK